MGEMAFNGCEFEFEKRALAAVDPDAKIGGDRRADRRYELRLEVRWKLIRRRRVLDSGEGRTLDLSSGGLLFDAGRPLPVGLNVELAVLWPVLLHNVAPLQLLVTGRVTRSEGNRVAVATSQHEFRTLSTLDDDRPQPFVRKHTPLPKPDVYAAATLKVQ
jgi:hypothetical protein